MRFLFFLEAQNEMGLGCRLALHLPSSLICCCLPLAFLEVALPVTSGFSFLFWRVRLDPRGFFKN